MAESNTEHEEGATEGEATYFELQKGSIVRSAVFLDEAVSCLLAAT